MTVPHDPQRTDLVELDPLSLATILLQRWRTVAAVPLVLCTIVGTTLLLRDRTYSSAVAFAPSSAAGAASRFAGIAAQFGVSLGGGGTEPTQTPDLYVDLLRSDQLLRALGESTFWRLGEEGDTIRGDLVALNGIEGESRALQMDALLMQLRQDVGVGTGLKSGLVNLRIRSRWPDLSLQMAERTLELVNDFGIRSRNFRAAAERRFTEDRLREAQADLVSAENAQRDFLNANRNYTSAPRLVLEFERLQRRVTIQEQLYAALMQSLAQARLDEFRNTPVISVIEPPQRALLPDRRGIIFKEIGTGLLGLGLGVVLVLAGAYAEDLRRRRPAGAAAMREAWRAFRTDLKRWVMPWSRRGH